MESQPDDAPSGAQQSGPAPVPDRIAQAFLTIAAAHGLDHATMRAVAKVAGVAVGSVQYYCRDHDGMLVMAYHLVMDRILQRGAALSETGSVGEVFRAFAVEFLPTTQQHADEQRIYLAFVARAAVDPKLAQIQHEYTAQLLRRCADAFQLAMTRGEAVAEFDANDAAWSTIALIDGLIVHMLSEAEPLPAETAVRILDRHLARYIVIGRG